MRWSLPVAVSAAALVASGVARAHVQYVTEDGSPVGDVIGFVVSVLAVPVNAALVGLGGIGALAALVWYRRARPLAGDIAALRTALAEYEPYVPWMLRLSLGLPLLGAGFAGYLFTPVVPTSLRLPPVVLGFLLLFGLATRATAVAGLLGYLAGLVAYPEFLLAGEYVGGFIAVILLGPGRPSADHLLQRVADSDDTLYGRVDPVHELANRFNDVVAPHERFAPLAVRLSLGATFVYLGFWEKLAHPDRALSVVDKYDLTALVPVDPGLWVLGAGLTEVAIGLLLVVGLHTRAAAALGFLTLTLTLFGLPDDPVLAHVTLFGLTSMLFVTGAGPRSVDARLERREPTGPVESPAG